MKFSGEAYNTIDVKGRTSIPVEFREALARAGEPEVLVVTKNRDGGLTAFPPSEWEAFVGRLEAQPAGRKKTAMNRLYIAPMKEVRLDRQGRIPLSRALRKYAGIGDDENVVIVGNFRRIDMFSESRYAEVVGEDVDLLQDDEELIAELDLP